MSAFDVLLFLHLTALVAAFFTAGALHTAEYLRGGCRTVAELRRVHRPLRFGPAFAPIILALLGFGMALVKASPDDDKFHVSDPFAWTAIVLLVMLFLDGPLILGRHADKLEKALEAAPEGPIPDDIRVMAFDLTTWRVSHANTASVLAVIYNMTNKPGVGVCIADILGAAVLGAAVGQILAGRASATSAAVATT
jgi:hypothetical protein